MNKHRIALSVAGLAVAIVVCALIAVPGLSAQTPPQVGPVDRRAAEMLEEALVPIGTMVPFLGDPQSLERSAWQLCDGKPLREDADAGLRGTLGGRGASVPDMARRVVYGIGKGVEVNKPYGTETHKHGMKHSHTAGGIPVTVKKTEGTGNATFHGGATKAGGRGDKIKEGGGDGTFVWATDEDTIWASFRQHRHTVDINISAKTDEKDNGEPVQTGPSSADNTDDAESFPPGLGVQWIMRIK